jgi:fructokinase
MPARPTIVAIGEVLWDMFPNGPQFGGAPANFACSLANLCCRKMDVQLVSAVGRDALGRRALELLQARGVGTDFVVEVDRPTGQVLVHVDERGQPSYEIATETAWDEIPWSDELAGLAFRADAVCFGTLGQRGTVSQATIQRFLRTTRDDCLKVLDINLRPPFWNDELLSQSQSLANALKLNDAELSVLAERLQVSGSDDEQLRSLHERFGLRVIALTRGDCGARISQADGECSDLPTEKVSVVNTVGAGDAYTAAMVLGILHNMPLSRMNAWANRVAAFVCTQPGAAPELPAIVRAL